MSRQSTNILDLDEKRKNALALINRDRGRLAGKAFPTYTQNVEVPMSSLTQRKRALEDRFRQEPAPYMNETSNVLKRTPQGFSSEQKQSLMDLLSSGSRDLNDKLAWNVLSKQFGDRIDNRKDRFILKGEKDLSSMLPVSRIGIDALSDDARGLDASFNTGLINVLNALGTQEKVKRERLTDMLGSFGNQAHMYQSLHNQAQRNKFDKEANLPYNKIRSLSNAISANSGNPELMGEFGEAAGIKELDHAMKAYNTPNATYQGQTVANLPANMQASHELLEGLSPDYRDKNYDQRSDLVNSLMNQDNIGNRTISNLPADFTPREQALDLETKRLIKRAKNQITGDNIARGVYGSQAHIKAVEDATRDIIRKRFGNRNNLLQDTMRGRMSSLNKDDVSNLEQVSNLGNQGLSEYKNILDTIKGTNQAGIDQWSNEQNKLNEEQQKFDESLENEWGGPSKKSPHLSALSTQQGMNHAMSMPSIYTPSFLPNTKSMALDTPIIPHSETSLAQSEVKNKPLINNQDEFKKAQSETLRRQQEAARQAQLKKQQELNAKRQAEIQKQQEAARNAANQKRQQEEARINNLFKDMTIYDTGQMYHDFNQLPYKDAGGLSWHPAAHFLRNNLNALSLAGTGAKQHVNPDGRSSKYGMMPTSHVNAFFSNPQNYPAGHLATYGYYKPPVRTLAELRKFHNFKQGGIVTGNKINPRLALKK